MSTSSTVRRGGALIIAGLTLVLAGCGSSTKPAQSDGTTVASVPATEADAYCTSKGGATEQRQATFNTNGDPSTWVALGEPKTFCRFVAADESRIYVDVDTLASTEPTLAAAAYLAKVPVTGATGGANPAAIGCNQVVLGTSSYGTTVSGGGWVNRDDPDFTVVDMCTFADGSAIDEWGITYYSNGAVRGADLAPMFRFDTAVVSKLFPSSSRAGIPTSTTT